MPKKQEKRYCLCVELIIDGKKELVCLAKYDLITLQKYTSFCSDAEELLKFMPEDDLISTKDYILKKLNDFSMKEDPFSIRGTDSFHSKKIPILYKKDEDILLYSKQEIIDCIKRKYFINLSDVESGTIDDKIKDFFISIWDKYRSDEIEKILYRIIEKRIDCDKPENYDSRYGKILNNKWMLLGVSGKFLSCLIDYIWNDTKKRLEFIKFLKLYDNNLLPKFDHEEKKKRMSLLEKELNEKGITVHRIRKRIIKNIKPLVPKKKEMNPIINISTGPITERQILDYNKERKGKIGPIFDEILRLSEKLEKLKSELLITRNIAEKKDLEKEIEELEYKIFELENNHFFFSDSGERIKEEYDEDKKLK